jgi:hypothetical protein
MNIIGDNFKPTKLTPTGPSAVASKPVKLPKVLAGTC